VTGLLVDTHVVLWHLRDDTRLGPRPSAALESGVDVFVSAASFWEIAIKSARGKLDVPDDLPDAIERAGFALLDVTPKHVWAVRALPPHHGDPFDRLLVAQAREEGLTLLSSDSAFAAYDVPTVWD